MAQPSLDLGSVRWQHPAEGLALRAREVHVWRIPLDARSWPGRRASTLLEHWEVQRLRSIRSRRERRRYLIAHAGLKVILARYLGVAPRAVRLVLAASGKPMLADSQHLIFSLGHSGGLALCAVTRARRIGVDVERVRGFPGLEDIVARAFSPPERAALSRLSPSQRHRAVFRCWTCKEAYVKATGRGLRTALRDIEVSVTRCRFALTRVGASTEKARQWSVLEVIPAADYVGAVVVEGGPVRVICMRVPVSFWS